MKKLYLAFKVHDSEAALNLCVIFSICFHSKCLDLNFGEFTKIFKMNNDSYYLLIVPELPLP
jgi:hypothetical protein